MLCLSSSYASASTKWKLLSRIREASVEIALQNERKALVRSSLYNINALCDSECLLLFQLKKEHIGKISSFIKWKEQGTAIARTPAGDILLIL